MSSKRAAVSSPTEGNNTSQSTQNEVSPKDPPPAIANKKRGRKKGTKLELAALQEGGSGGRARVQMERNEEPRWNFSSRKVDDEEDSGSSWSSVDSDDISSVELDDFAEPEEEEETCLTNLAGNRILPVQQIVKVFHNHVCCSRCAVRHTYLHFYLSANNSTRRES